MAYTQLNIIDRHRIADLQAQGASLRQIAAVLDRASSTVARELKRNRLPAGPHRHVPLHLPCPMPPPACGLPYTPHRPTPAPRLRAAADGFGSRRSRWPPPSPCGAPFPSLHPHHYAPFPQAQAPRLQMAMAVDLLKQALSPGRDAPGDGGSGAWWSRPATLPAAAGPRTVAPTRPRRGGSPCRGRSGCSRAARSGPAAAPKARSACALGQPRDSTGGCAPPVAPTE